MNCWTLLIVLLTSVFVLSHSGEAIFPFNKLMTLVFYVLYGHQNKPPPLISPPINTPTPGVLEYYGYPAETHEVITEDGYILLLHRIPHSKTSNSSTKEPIILIPGLLASSLYFLIGGEHKSPALYYSSIGHDIWLHNNRGTRFSRNHTTLSPDKDRQYWNFSFHEMGAYDLPAVMDYILSTTKARQVFMLGHSLGATLIPLFLAEKPTYNDKVKSAFLLAPAVKMTRTKYPLGHHQITANILLPILEEMELAPYSKNLFNLMSYFCSDPSGNKICKQILFTGTGSNIFDEPDSFMNEIIRTQTGTSVKTIRHFMQMIKRNDFAHYDYGKRGNMQKYGQESSPKYNIGAITTPISVYVGNDDFITNYQDFTEAILWFPKGIQVTTVDGFFHMDFVVSKQAKRLVYEPIMYEMMKLENKHFSPQEYVINTVTLTAVIILFSFLLLSLLCLLNRRHNG